MWACPQLQKDGTENICSCRPGFPLLLLVSALRFAPRLHCGVAAAIPHAKALPKANNFLSTQLCAAVPKY